MVYTIEFTKASLTPFMNGQNSRSSLLQFEKAVWAERYFELAFKNKMWFDMIRTRKVRNDLTKNWDNFVGHTNLFGKTFAEKNLLLPIPQREIDNNRNLVQNTGFR